MSYRRSQEQKRRLHKLYLETKNYYGCGVWFDENKQIYVRYYSSGKKSGKTKFYRRVSNKKVRKSEEVFSYNQYRKLFDYWWTLF